MKYSGEVENAIEKQNGVAQGFIVCNYDQQKMKEAEKSCLCRTRLWNSAT
jgi:hypothetical protein